jgi:hypothetical protein
MTKKIEITSLKLTNYPIRTVKYTETVEAELRLTFKVLNTEDCLTDFLDATKKDKTVYYWESIKDKVADFREFDIDKINTDSQFTRMKEGIVHDNPWLTYKPKFDTFIYHKFFTWNLVTQATIQQIKLLEAGLNSHYMYEEATTLLACLQTLNSWET